MVSKNEYGKNWEALKMYFQKIAATLQGEYPGHAADIDWYQTDTLPFVGYISFMRKNEPCADEDCVLMMKVARSRNHLIVTSDISSDSGELFAEVSSSIDENESDGAKVRFLYEAEKEAEKFFEDNLSVIRMALLSKSD